jgi:hypothetical protein
VRFVSVCGCATIADRYLVATLDRVAVGERLPAVGAVRGSCDGFITGFAVCAAVAALACCASPLLTLVPAVWALAVALVQLRAVWCAAHHPPGHRFVGGVVVQAAGVAGGAATGAA